MAGVAGDVVWVTGAGSGIGRACALAFAKAGAKVALTGRRREALEETAALIAKEGPTALVVPADVADAEAVKAAHAAVVAGLGEVAVLVSCAGGNMKKRHWAQLDPADMSWVVDLDLKSMFYLTLAVLPAMRARREGRIIQIASQAGATRQTVAGPTYSAAKTGVVAMSANLNAEEGIHGIRSICISPGEVVTPILKTRPVQPTEEELALMLQPEDVAETALFAASLPARACLAEILLLPTDDRHARPAAKAIAATVARG